MSNLEKVILDLIDKRLNALGVAQKPTPASIRIEAGYPTIDALAAAAGVPASTLRRYETGRFHHLTNASFENFKRISSVCGVPVLAYANACQFQKGCNASGS